VILEGHSRRKFWRNLGEERRAKAEDLGRDRKKSWSFYATMRKWLKKFESKMFNHEKTANWGVRAPKFVYYPTLALLVSANKLDQLVIGTVRRFKRLVNIKNLASGIVQEYELSDCSLRPKIVFFCLFSLKIIQQFEGKPIRRKGIAVGLRWDFCLRTTERYHRGHPPERSRKI
jgi:hypothetical protein